MEVFANVATVPVRKESKLGKVYWEMRICESQRGADPSPCFYTARIMRSEDPCLSKGDFVKVTGKLKTDFYLSREGKPTGTLLIIAFAASKIAKPVAAAAPAAAADDGAAPKARAAVVPEARAAAPTAKPTQTSTTPVIAQAPMFDWRD